MSLIVVNSKELGLRQNVWVRTYERSARPTQDGSTSVGDKMDIADLR